MSDEPLPDPYRADPPTQPTANAQTGWALPDQSPPPGVPQYGPQYGPQYSPPPQYAPPNPWPQPPQGPRPMPTWAKFVLGCGVAYYVLAFLGVIIGAIAVYFASRR